MGGSLPAGPVSAQELPAVDTAGHIRYLASGWRCRTESGLVMAGVGGIEAGQRRAAYHPMAYLDEEAILTLLEGPAVDLLITHQGPDGVQGDHGSKSLQLLLDEALAKVWCHGHSIANPAIAWAGRRKSTLVVPLGDVAFLTRKDDPAAPGEDGWACLSYGPEVAVRRERPPFWREFRRNRWTPVGDGQLVCPDLAVGLWQ